MGIRYGWVTFVKDERDAKRALILLRSLRRVFTSAELVVLLPSYFPGHLWSHLSWSFDQVIVLPQKTDSSRGESDASSNFTAIRYASSQTQFERLIFLDHDSLVLANVDDMFETIQFQNLATGRNGCESGFSLIMPSRDKNTKYISSSSSACHEADKIPKNILRLDKLTMSLTHADWLLENPKILQGMSHLEALAKRQKGGKLPSFFRDILEMHAVLGTEVDAFLGDEATLHRDLFRCGWKNEPIAVVGMSCRLPGCNNAEEYWNKLLERASLVSSVPLDRKGWNSRNGAKGGFLPCSISAFDAPFFCMSPREAEFTDPQHRLQMELLWEALEEAGINPTSLRGSNTALYTSSWTSGYSHLLAKEGIPETEPYRSYMGTGLAGWVAKMAHFLGVNGPCVASESTCSSSAQSVGMGMTDLRLRRTRLALVSGVNLIVTPFTASSFSFLLSRDYGSKIFEAGADGYVRAEGVGTLVLKRLSDAVNDGDRIHILLRGFGMAQEGNSPSIGTPTAEGEALAMRKALDDAGVLPEEVQVVEAHATGTSIGDPMEIRAIKEVYSTPKRTVPLVITGGKCATGHTETFSGIAGIIKTILMMKHGIIPPQINLTQLNPDIVLDTIPAEILIGEAKAWDAAGAPRIAGVSSFGITGTNTHIILQEPPKPVLDIRSKKASPAFQVLTLSAQSAEALHELVGKYKTYFRALDGDSVISLDAIAFTANTGRAPFPNRIALFGRSIAELLTKLESGKYHQGSGVFLGTPLTFLFPGQGSIFSGMGKSLYDSFPVFQRAFDACAKLIWDQHLVDLKKAAWGSSGKINTSLVSTFLIFTIEHCIRTLWKSWGVTPSTVCGHSLGEIAAAEAAGLITLDDAFSLLKRGALMDTLGKGKMAVVRQDEKTAQSSIRAFLGSRKNKTKHWLDVAAANSASQTVVSGPPKTINKFLEFAKNNSIHVHVLDTTHAYHSRALDSIVTPYKGIAQSIAYTQGGTCTFISSVDGAVHKHLTTDYWVSNLRDKVNFVAASKTLVHQDEALICVEVGGHPILSPLLLENSKNGKIKCFPTMRKPHPTKTTLTEVETMLDTLCKLYVEGVPVDWEGFHALHSREKVSLPTYPFQRKAYWWCSKEATSFHPLLGKRVDLPQTQKKTHFQNPDFSLKALPPYLRDHQIGTMTLLPAAGFLEICLAAAHEQDKVFPLSLSDISISRALILDEERATLHTQVSFGDEGKATVQVLSRKGDETLQWHEHAKAQFPGSFPGVESISIDSLKDPSFQLRDTEELYMQLRSVGYNFGPSFQSVTRTWIGPSSFLSEIRFPLQYHDEKDLLPPIVLDGMFQSLPLMSMMDGRDNAKGIFLPVAVSSCTLLSKWKPGMVDSREAVFYAHIPWTQTDTPTVILYSDGGTPLAVMEGVVFVPTSLPALERRVRQRNLDDTSAIPLYYENWIAVDNHNLGPPFFHSQIGVDVGGDLVKRVDTEVEDRFIGLAVLDTFMALGILNLKERSFLNLDLIVKDLHIRPDLSVMVSRLLDILVEDGFASYDTSTAFSPSPGLPSVPEIREDLTRIETENKESYDMAATAYFCAKIPAIILGKELVSDTLFGDDSHPYSAKSLGSNLSVEKTFQEGIASILRVILSKASDDGKGVLRILEVAGTTGGRATDKILEHLKELGVRYEYDIWSATVRTGNSRDSLNYRVLDIVKDPKLQGYPPSQYDLVLADNVDHTLPDMTQGIRNILHLIRPNGFLLLWETFKPSRFRDIVYGSITPNRTILSRGAWERLLCNVGLHKVTSFEEGLCLAQRGPESLPYIHTYALKSWILFDSQDGDALIQILGVSIKTNGDAVILLRPSDSLMDVLGCPSNDVVGLILPAWTLGTSAISAVHKLLEVSQAFLASSTGKLPKIVVLTRGSVCVTPEESMYPHHASILGFARVFMSENPDAWVKVIDLGLESTEGDIGHIIHELWLDSGDPLVSYRKTGRYVPRLQKVRQLRSFPPLEVHLSSEGRFRMVLPPSKLLTDISFAPDSVHPVELKDDEVEISIRATGLNYRDLLIVLKPIQDFESINNFGMDVSGEVVRVGRRVSQTKVGDRVMAERSDQLDLPLSSHVIKKEGQFVSIPHNMTFEEAATLPAVFASAYACLLTIGNLQAGKTLLVHTASGGMGLAVIQLAQRIGAKIIGTAGSPKKRAYLRSIGVTTVFDSRDTSFVAGVLDATDGVGVDIVINTLTSDGFIEASLACVKKGGRFIEIGKLDIWTEEQVQSARPDVSYTVLDFVEARKTWADEAWFVNMLGHMKICKPITYTRFFLSDVKDALRHMQKAKHIGKIVLTMPLRDGGFHLFNKVSSYVVTGGTTGIGFEVGRWIVENGGKHVILVGRRPICKANQGILDTLDHKCVVSIHADVGDLEACRGIMTYITENSLPPLRGIMHAAGVLSDGVITNQTIDKFDLALHPKIRGVLNLHEVSKDCHLEHFVLFSSITAIIGTPGQSNYAAANAFLDSFAHYRRSLGLTASTVNWGLWREVGMGVGLNVRFASSHSTKEGLATLEAVLRYNVGQIAPAVIHPSEILKMCPWLDTALQSVLSETPDNKYLGHENVSPSSERFWKDFNSAQGEEKKTVLSTYVEEAIRSVLGLPAAETILENQEFQGMGMDSLMLIELRNKIQAQIGKEVPLGAAVMMKCKSLSLTKGVLFEQLGLREEEANSKGGNGKSKEIII